ncbi:hypothetical protein IQ22_01672 [Pseudomonas duriflava]|uniref:Uncharacterized protein n=1 Tax=Pseudomonas duriflava TaxID=459528 RepID=A0A562QG84_9PSED|nr:hypothetical protein IQ22_01672 [Pseudomonas duriflava]
MTFEQIEDLLLRCEKGLSFLHASRDWWRLEEEPPFEAKRLSTLLHLIARICVSETQRQKAEALLHRLMVLCPWPASELQLMASSAQELDEPLPLTSDVPG